VTNGNKCLTFNVCQILEFIIHKQTVKQKSKHFWMFGCISFFSLNHCHSKIQDWFGYGIKYVQKKFKINLDINYTSLASIPFLKSTLRLMYLNFKKSKIIHNSKMIYMLYAIDDVFIVLSPCLLQNYLTFSKIMNNNKHLRFEIQVALILWLLKMIEINIAVCHIVAFIILAMSWLSFYILPLISVSV
jgi:hypothetical protein